MADHHDEDYEEQLERERDAAEALYDRMKEEGWRPIPVKTPNLPKIRAGKRVQGFIARVSSDPDFRTYSYRYFTKQRDAKKWALVEVEKWNQNYARINVTRPIYHRVEPKVFNACRCGKLKDIDELQCSMCEKVGEN